jgi:glycosyltransferase involved in cell wall biosynthesis
MADQLGGGGRLAVAFTSDPGKHARRRAAAHGFADARYGVFRLQGVEVSLGTEYVAHLAYRLPALVRRLRPDVVAVGGFGSDAVLAQAACRVLGCPSVVWSGAWLGPGDAESRVRTLARRCVVGTACAGVTYGTLARDYLVELGMPVESIRAVTNTVDVEAFAATATKARGARVRLTQLYGLAAQNLLYVGGLLPRKGVRELLAAFAAMPLKAPSCALHMAGTGPLREELATVAAGVEEGKTVVFHGFLQERDVAELAGLCDGFVFPSLHEVWGLVLNEAMACGLPVIASCHAGATPDLLVDGVNGYLVDPARPAEMAARMSDLLADEGRRARMGEAALATVRERASLAMSASSFLEALTLARELHAARH